MMKSRYILKVVFSVVFTATFFCAVLSSVAFPDELASQPQRILFIGNSYTDQVRGGLMDLLAKSPYKKTVFEFITKGGATLQQHVNNKDTLERVTAGNWDLVVLQDQSQTPALPGEYQQSFHTSVDKFTKLIRKSGAEPVLYMTWGRRDGDKVNAKLFPDYDTMQQKLSDAYREAAQRNKITLAPVGDVWSIIRKKDEVLGSELYKKDGSHPSAKGAYLVSCVFFRVLFDDSLKTILAEDIMNQAESQLVKNTVVSSIQISPKKLDRFKDK